MLKREKFSNWSSQFSRFKIWERSYNRIKVNPTTAIQLNPKMAIINGDIACYRKPRRDKYFRILCEVWINGRNINKYGSRSVLRSLINIPLNIGWWLNKVSPLNMTEAPRWRTGASRKLIREAKSLRVFVVLTLNYFLNYTLFSWY